MHKFMIALLETSITMSVIAFIYIAITPLLFKSFTAKGRYYTWLVIVIGLIIPFRFYPQVSAIYVDRLLPSLKIMSGQTIDQAVSNEVVTSSSFSWSMLICGV